MESSEIERQSLRSQLSQQTALAALSQLAQTDANVDILFKQAEESIRHCMGADVVVLLEQSTCDAFPLVFGSGAPVVIARFDNEASATLPEELRDTGITSGICIRVPSPPEAFRLIFAGFRGPHELTEFERSFLHTLSNILGTAIHRKTIADELERTAVELKRSNLDLQQFAYAAAHDLQEPLRSIVSYLELLGNHLDGNLDEKSQKYMSVSMAAGKRMQALINDLLEYSRVSTRAQTPQETDSGQLVSFVVQDLRHTLDKAKARVEFENLPVVDCDPIQLAMVFQNLIGNAIKFRKPEEPPVVKISAKRANQHWEFFVQDNGIGFEMQYASRIFIIFQRLHTRQKYSGTGIGLALCKKIIERHGGEISVESISGVGTTFSFTLPILR